MGTDSKVMMGLETVLVAVAVSTLVLEAVTETAVVFLAVGTVESVVLRTIGAEAMVLVAVVLHSVVAVMATVESDPVTVVTVSMVESGVLAVLAMTVMKPSIVAMLAVMSMMEASVVEAIVALRDALGHNLIRRGGTVEVMLIPPLLVKYLHLENIPSRARVLWALGQNGRSKESRSEKGREGLSEHLE